MERKARNPVGWIIIFLLGMALLGSVVTLFHKPDKPHPGKRGAPQEFENVQSVKSIKTQYDVVVVGTDPEGVMAAVSAARNGLHTLLVDNRGRKVLGGLMTVGWLNSIDMVTIGPSHELLNKGLFEEWYKKVEGDSFDVKTAANAFYDMVKKEKNIDLLLETTDISPLMDGSTVRGVKLVLKDGTAQNVKAKSVIDATQDADIAAAAGAQFTMGREDLGDPKSRMAVTLVFSLKNVTKDVWDQVKKRLNGDNDPNTGANEMSAWGYGEMYGYPPLNKERLKMRGLNIGRQNDQTMLINALLLFGVDDLDPASRQEGIKIAQAELPNIVDYMKKTFPEFANLELAATAPELYVRETRHLVGEYRLSIVDVLENRDQWDRVAFGSYPVDLQKTSPADGGAVVVKPEQYAIPFRSLVPQKVDGLLVVGRSASFDSLPHGSARVIPVGMATGQAAGAAAKLAQQKGATFRDMSKDKGAIAELQATLGKQAMDLKAFTSKRNAYMDHPAYPGLKTAVTMMLAFGSYGNDFGLDKTASPAGFANVMSGMKRYLALKAGGDPFAAANALKAAKDQPLTLDQAAMIGAAAVGVKADAKNARSELVAKGYWTEATVGKLSSPDKLTVGDEYLLLNDMALKLGFVPKP